jgi:hypothetical protein
MWSRLYPDPEHRELQLNVLLQTTSRLQSSCLRSDPALEFLNSRDPQLLHYRIKLLRSMARLSTLLLLVFGKLARCPVDLTMVVTV